MASIPPKKKKRTILASEDESRVTLPSMASRIKSIVKDTYPYRLRARGGGLGGTIGTVDRTNKPDTTLKWSAGVVKGTSLKDAADKFDKESKIPKNKSKRGFNIKVSF